MAQASARPLVFLRLNAARLAEPSYSETEHPRLESDGGGLASVLAFMALSDPDGFHEFMDHVRELVPQIKRIRFRKVPVQRRDIESITIGSDSGERRTIRTYQGEVLLFDFTNASDVIAHTVSEGTLMILGLLTALVGPNHPKVLLMDDIEHGLHPLAQVSLLGTIKRVMEKFPELQILATAHSPYLLDQLEPQQIRLMTTGIDGYSVCGRLADHPQFAQWKDEMAPGELWSLFGEKWIAEKGRLIEPGVHRRLRRSGRFRAGDGTCRPRSPRSDRLVGRGFAGYPATVGRRRSVRGALDLEVDPESSPGVGNQRAWPFRRQTWRT